MQAAGRNIKIDQRGSEMSVSEQLMELMKKGIGGNKSVEGMNVPNADDSVSAGDSSSAPAASGMAKPTKNVGAKASARIQVHMALNVLGKALSDFGDNESDDSRVILSAIKKLSSKFGDSPEKELVPAQILQLFKSEPTLSGKQAQMQQQPQQQQSQGANLNV
jgi:hypothetical protein